MALQKGIKLSKVTLMETPYYYYELVITLGHKSVTETIYKYQLDHMPNYNIEIKVNDALDRLSIMLEAYNLQVKAG